MTTLREKQWNGVCEKRLNDVQHDKYESGVEIEGNERGTQGSGWQWVT